MPQEANYEQAEKDYMNGMKYKDIANKYGVSLNTVKSWKTRYKWNKKGMHTKSEKVCTQKKDAESKKRKTKEHVVKEVEEIIQNTELTDKQRLFCVYYIRCFNATRAYQKAYECDYVTAVVNGPRLLGNARVKEEITRLKQDRLNREFFSEEDIFQKYMDIAFADITDFLSFGQREVPVMGAFGPVTVKDEDTGRDVQLTKIVNTVSFRESCEVDGTLISEVKQGKDGASIKLADRMKALQWLSDHMNMATEEQKAKIAQMKAQTEQIKNASNDKGDAEVADWIAGVMGALEAEDAGDAT